MIITLLNEGMMHFKIKINIWLVVYLSIVGTSYSQEKKIKRLFIGDTVPDIVFDEVLNYPSNGEKRLSDFKGKCIILDFWNKSCTNCIGAFPEMQNLQKAFGNDLQVLLIGSNTKEELMPLLQRSPILKATNLPMILGKDQKLQQLFPYRSVPYHVWLDKNGVVRATTNGEAATNENIRDLIAEKTLKVPIREDLLDIDIDEYTTLLRANNGRYLKNLLYYKEILPSSQKTEGVTLSGDSSAKREDYFPAPFYSMIMRKIIGYDRWGINALLSDSVSNKQIGLRFTQQSIPALYTYAYNVPNDMNLIMEGKGKEYFEPKNNSAIEFEKWMNNYTFSYEAILPVFNKDTFQNIMREDLNSFFKISVEWEERVIPCLILFRTSKRDKLASKGGNFILEDTKSNRGIIFNNVSFNGFIVRLKIVNRRVNGLFFVNETGIEQTKKIDLIIKSSLSNIPQLAKELNNYGLGIKVEDRKTKVCVLKKL